MVRKLSRQQKAANTRRLNEDYTVVEGPAKTYSPSTPLTLCGQLEDAILLLETRISNAIAKINSLM